MTIATVAALPAHSEAPGRTPTTQAGCSEAVLVACVLAEHYNTFSGLVGITCLMRARDCVERHLPAAARHADVLRWQQRVPAEQWAIRWETAIALAVACYPELCADTTTVPGFYDMDFMVLADKVAA